MMANAADKAKDPEVIRHGRFCGDWRSHVVLYLAGAGFVYDVSALERKYADTAVAQAASPPSGMWGMVVIGALTGDGLSTQTYSPC